MEVSKEAARHRASLLASLGEAAVPLFLTPLPLAGWPLRFPSPLSLVSVAVVCAVGSSSGRLCFRLRRRLRLHSCRRRRCRAPHDFFSTHSPARQPARRCRWRALVLVKFRPSPPSFVSPTRPPPDSRPTRARRASSPPATATRTSGRSAPRYVVWWRRVPRSKPPSNGDGVRRRLLLPAGHSLQGRPKRRPNRLQTRWRQIRNVHTDAQILQRHKIQDNAQMHTGRRISQFAHSGIRFGVAVRSSAVGGVRGRLEHDGHQPDAQRRPSGPGAGAAWAGRHAQKIAAVQILPQIAFARRMGSQTGFAAVGVCRGRHRQHRGVGRANPLTLTKFVFCHIL